MERLVISELTLRMEALTWFSLRRKYVLIIVLVGKQDKTMVYILSQYRDPPLLRYLFFSRGLFFFNF